MALGLGAAAAGTGFWRSPVALPEEAENFPYSPHHLAWVWQFDRDGPPATIRRVLAGHKMGIAMKSHDGTDWMSGYDASPFAVDGPGQVKELVNYFGSAGVPLHAWCVLKGLDPRREAKMCADVLAAGARSMILDVEPHPGFWTATAEEAAVFGEELRGQQPDAQVVVAVDPRPWQLERIPLETFAAFSDELAPQIYWEDFNSWDNWRGFTAIGASPGNDGVTPRFLLDLSVSLLAPYGLPIHPIGQADTREVAAWNDFMQTAMRHEVSAVSAWRFGVTPSWVWRALGDADRFPQTYRVREGDTLGALAAAWRTSVPAIAELNGIQNPDILHTGQKLVIPNGARVSRRTRTP